MKLRLGTRGSPLAKTQSAWVADRLRMALPELDIEIVEIVTSGDRGLTTTGDANLKALFTKEIDEALLGHRIDFAVHSLKDMNADMPPGLVLAAVPEREDARDAWVSRTGKKMQETPAGARVGTGSVRRGVQLRFARPDFQLLPLRGNVDTRLKKLEAGEYDAILLACAGLRRLHLAERITESLTPEIVLPAVGQGCLALQCRDTDTQVHQALGAINHAPSYICAIAERAFLKALGGSCQTPIAAYAQVLKNEVQLTGAVFDPAGRDGLKESARGSIENAESVGADLAEQLLALGAGRWLS